MEIKEKDEVTDNNGVGKCAGIVPAPLCVTLYIKDAMFLQSDRAYRMLKKVSAREHNVKFVQMVRVESLREVTSHGRSAVEFLRRSKMEKSCF